MTSNQLWLIVVSGMMVMSSCVRGREQTSSELRENETPTYIMVVGQVISNSDGNISKLNVLRKLNPNDGKDLASESGDVVAEQLSATVAESSSLTALQRISRQEVGNDQIAAWGRSENGLVIEQFVDCNGEVGCETAVQELVKIVGREDVRRKAAEREAVERELRTVEDLKKRYREQPATTRPIESENDRVGRRATLAEGSSIPFKMMVTSYAFVQPNANLESLGSHVLISNQQQLDIHLESLVESPMAITENEGSSIDFENYFVWAYRNIVRADDETFSGFEVKRIQDLGNGGTKIEMTKLKYNRPSCVAYQRNHRKELTRWTLLLISKEYARNFVVGDQLIGIETKNENATDCYQ